MVVLARKGAHNDKFVIHVVDTEGANNDVILMKKTMRIVQGNRDFLCLQLEGEGAWRRALIIVEGGHGRSRSHKT